MFRVTKNNYALLFAGILFLAISTQLVGQSYTYWKYTSDRFNRKVLIDGLEVPSGADPYTWLAEYLQFGDWTIRQNENSTYLAEKSSRGKIPILGLHKIGDEDNYALSSRRFRQLLKFINNNNWYMVADYQYITGDFTNVPTGYKPIVLGADDASWGNVIFETKGNNLFSRTKSYFGKPRLDKKSMAAILERHARRENGRINFTFYVSFDAVPFRQLAGHKNPGFPYADIPIVADKIQYIDENFILGIHSLSHTYAYDMGPDEFARDVKAAWTMLDDYADGKAESVQTMSYPYGISPLTDEMRQIISSITLNGRHLVGAFDLDGNLSPPPGQPSDPFCVSRLNLDNSSWEDILRILQNIEAVEARREIIWETDVKRLPLDIQALGAKKSDGVWVLVKQESDKKQTLVKSN